MSKVRRGRDNTNMKEKFGTGDTKRSKLRHALAGHEQDNLLNGNCS